MEQNLPDQVLEIYEDLDLKMDRLKRITGVHCFRSCGSCCERATEVESTVLELLPLAREIFRRGAEETISLKALESEERGEPACILYHPFSTVDPGGGCAFYPFRPLTCRLFGFAARKNKRGLPEFAPCGLFKSNQAEAVRLASFEVSAGLDVPVYQESFIRVASLNPGMGYPIMPFSKALAGALQYLYWGTRWKGKHGLDDSPLAA